MAKKNPKKSGWKRKVAVGAAAVAASGAVLWASFGPGVSVPFPAYRASQVIDGDTFETTEKQSVRIVDINAPELDRCGGQEAKKALEKLVLNENLYIKVVYRQGTRLISHVYNKDGSVAVQLAKQGLVYNADSGEKNEEVSEAARIAREQKIGIFSEKCTQTTNPENRFCVVKGNISDFNSGSKYYRFPGCKQYNQTLVQLSKGDQWFCTEAEAKKAGFTKGTDCENKTWK